MSHTTISVNRVAVCFGLAAALMATGCNGNRSYSLGGGGDFGAAGPEGQAGPQGEAGPAGPAGPQGPAGANGGLLGGGGGTGGGLLGGVADGLGQVSVGDRTILGQSGQGGPLGVSVLSPTQQEGGLATVGVLSGGQVATVGVGSATTPVTNASGPASGLLGVTLGGNQLVGSSQGNPAIDVNVLTTGSASGTAVTGNILSNGQPVGVGVANAPGGTPASGVLGGVTGVVGGVTGTVGGVLSGGQPANPVGGLLGGLPRRGN